MSPCRRSLALVFCLTSLLCTQQTIAQARAAAPSQSVPEPAPQASASTQRFSPAPPESDGLIKLDVVVTDKSGKPISGFESKDFTLLDNGQPSRILSFHAFDGFSALPDPPVEIILVIDTLYLPPRLAMAEREAVETFLHKNDGHLAQPVSVFELVATGLWAVAQPSRDGNALAADLAHSREISLVHSVRDSGAGDIPNSMGVKDPPSLKALKALGQISTAERRMHGRKLLVWVGPGWGVGSGAYVEGTSREDALDAIVWFSTLLREARITLYTLSVGETNSSSLYLNYLKGVPSARQASFMSLYRKVLAVQSGGRVLDTSYDLVRQIESCIQDASVFYTLSFDPPIADHRDEYHDLRVQIDKPGLTARTSTGYYDQPYYSDQPNPAIRRVTVDQLEQLLAAAHGQPDAEVARQLSNLELTERLSSTKLLSWKASLNGTKARQALVALADASVFLDPPQSEILADATPDLFEQKLMLSRALDYVNRTIPKLPNFYAARTTTRYDETPQFDKGNTDIGYEPLHRAVSVRETVFYRNRTEIVDSGTKQKKAKAEQPYLIIYGTFGPILNLVHDALANPGNLTWSRWEKGENGERAVFRYTVPAARSLYQVAGCCLPDGDGTSGFEILPEYHGKVVIEPATGAVLRFEAEADLEHYVPLLGANIMIEYGAVEMGGKTYICPLRSVSIMRSRSVAFLREWDEGFKTYGPYSTRMNDISYDSYHLFRAESRILSGFTAAPEEKSPPPDPPHSPAQAPIPQ